MLTRTQFIISILFVAVLFLGINVVHARTSQTEPASVIRVSAEIIPPSPPPKPQVRTFFGDLLASKTLNVYAHVPNDTTQPSEGILTGDSSAEIMIPEENISKQAIADDQPARSTETTIQARIAIIGDSMVDTMGEELEYLDAALRARYPNSTFNLYNYGTGAQTVEQGLARFHEPFSYRSRRFPPLSDLNPDIIIVGSFAYNPFTPHDRDRHWLELSKLVKEAQRTGARVYLLAENAPLRENFGRGEGGVNWDDESTVAHSGRVIEQLENTVGLAPSLGVPLIDAYRPSIVGSDSRGNPAYVSSHDGVHPSVAGHRFIANRIADTISF